MFLPEGHPIPAGVGFYCNFWSNANHRNIQIDDDANLFWDETVKDVVKPLSA